MIVVVVCMQLVLALAFVVLVVADTRFAAGLVWLCRDARNGGPMPVGRSTVPGGPAVSTVLAGWLLGLQLLKPAMSSTLVLLGVVLLLVWDWGTVLTALAFQHRTQMRCSDPVPPEISPVVMR